MDLVLNKPARANYDLIDTYEAGMYLDGWEVKSLRAGNANLRPAWIKLHDGAAWIENMHISPYRFANIEQPPTQPRKLLLSRRELLKIESKMNEKGLTLIPTRIYTKGRYLKCEIALARGRKKYEKREVLRRRDAEREVQKTLKELR